MKKQYLKTRNDAMQLEIQKYIDGKFCGKISGNCLYIDGYIQALESEGWSKGYNKAEIEDVESDILSCEMKLDELNEKLEIMKSNIIDFVENNSNKE